MDEQLALTPEQRIKELRSTGLANQKAKFFEDVVVS